MKSVFNSGGEKRQNHRKGERMVLKKKGGGSATGATQAVSLGLFPSEDNSLLNLSDFAPLNQTLHNWFYNLSFRMRARVQCGIV